MKTLKGIPMKLNQAGFSAVETLIAIGILAGAVAFSLQLSGVFNSQLQQSDQSRLSTYFHSDILARGKRMLVSVQDTNTPPRHTRAICSPNLIRTRYRSAGVGLIETNVNSVAANGVFTSAVWDSHFSPDWSASACPPGVSTSGSYMFRCYALNSTSALRQVSAKEDNIFAVVKVVPVTLDPTSSSAVFEPLSNTEGWTDAKKVAFQVTSTIVIETRVATSGGGTTTSRRNTETNSMIWTAEVGYCEINGLKAAVSGSGLGDWRADTVYNTTDYEEQSVGPLMVNVQKRVITEGEKIPYSGDQYMKANFDKNIEVSCTEQRFRCPNASANRTYFDTMAFRTNIRYFANNQVNSRVQNTFALNPQIIRQGTNTDLLAASRTDLAYRAAGQPFAERQGHLFQLDTAGNISNREFFVGGALTRTQMDVTINRANTHCQSICRDNHAIDHILNFRSTLWGYNRNNTDYIENIPNTSKNEPLINVGCNACYMKSCNRFGVAVFGPMKTQPAEPLDAGVPECAALDTAERSKVTDNPPNVVAGSPNQCVSYRYVNGQAVFTKRSCADNLPVICFAFGRFIPARELGSSNPYAFPEVSFNRAQDLCFEQGREAGLRTDLDRMMRTSYPAGSNDLNRELNLLAAMVPSGETNYNHVNLANQGMFMAPQRQAQWDELNASQRDPKLKYLDPGYPEIAGRDFWIALRTTSTGHTVPEIPVSQAKNLATENFAFYYLPTGRPKLNAFTANNAGIPNRLTTGSGVGLLVNHIKHRGVAFIDRTSTQQRPVLCRSKDAPHDFYVVQSVTHDQAAGACAGSNGVFAPPTTSLGWARAMKVILTGTNPNQDDPGYPFPLPQNMTSGAILPVTGAWVALEADVAANGFQGNNYRMPASHSVYNNIFNTSRLATARSDCQSYASRLAQYQADLDNYNNNLKPAYDQAYADWVAAGSSGSPPQEPRPPVRPQRPSEKCDFYLDNTITDSLTYSDFRDYRGRYYPYQDAGNEATHKICEGANLGDWSLISASQNCPMSSRQVREGDLSANYLNATKWLLIQASLASSTVIHLPR